MKPLHAILTKLFLAITISMPALANSYNDGWTAYSKGNYKTAINIFMQLAEQGDAAAQSNLGIMYTKDDGVPRDYKEAIKWYRLAAAQGDVESQTTLGIMYAKGQGVPEDKVFAYMWWNLSAASGSEDASKNKDIIIKSMTPSQVKKAQGLSKACLKSSYKNC